MLTRLIRETIDEIKQSQIAVYIFQSDSFFFGIGITKMEKLSKCNNVTRL